MKSKILNYLIVIEPDKRTGMGNACYSVYCPVLSLADSGDTIKEAIYNMEQLIAFRLECLKEETGYKDFMFSGNSDMFQSRANNPTQTILSRFVFQPFLFNLPVK